jgi:hypothetical protein
LRKSNLPRLHKKRNRSLSIVEQLPGAGLEGSASVPFALTACIPENAIRKFAAKEPFAIHLDCDSVKSLVLYLGD